MNGKYNVFTTVLLMMMMVATTMCQSSSEENDGSDEISQRIQNMEREGSNYLNKVMKQLQEDRVNNEIEEIHDPNFLYTYPVHDDLYEGPYTVVTPEYNITGPTPFPDLELNTAPEVPPLTLSKEELTALYQAAVTKASQLNLKLTDRPELQDESQAWEPTHTQVKPLHQGEMNDPLSGYYYYYFPIKSFQTVKKENTKPTSPPGMKTTSHIKPTSSPSTHQHLHATVTMVDSQNKVMEPLFMAISSFIGMALMFLVSVLLVPRFNKVKSKNSQFDDNDEEMRTLGQIILEALSGRDCNERLACEVARIFRSLKSDNKTLRILEILLPPDLSEHVARVRKAADKRTKCGYIVCQSRKPTRTTAATQQTPTTKAPIKTYKLRPWKEKETAHELWMKHFEKKKPPEKYLYHYPNRYELVENKT